MSGVSRNFCGGPVSIGHGGDSAGEGGLADSGGDSLATVAMPTAAPTADGNYDDGGADYSGGGDGDFADSGGGGDYSSEISYSSESSSSDCGSDG